MRFVLTFILYLLFKLIFKTYRFKIENQEIIDQLRESGKPFIYAFWHEHILATIASQNPHNVYAMISQSDDGQIATDIVKKMGFNAIRGSSDRRAVRVAKQAIKVLRAGSILGIAIDGPKGPRREIKEGIASIARLCEVPILGLVFRPQSYWEVRSWDRFKIPRPFSKIHLQYSQPVEIPKSANEELITTKIDELKANLNSDSMSDSP